MPAQQLARLRCLWAWRSKSRAFSRLPDLPASFLARPIAHRALHGAGRPENSRAAIRAAIASGYSIEIDLQASADHVPMVFHDESLERLTKTQGLVSDHTAAELQKIALRGSSETIPTLRDVLDLVAGQVPLLIEMKDQTGTLGTGPDLLEKAIARDLQAYRGDVALMSFNPACIHALARHAPDIARGLVTCAFHEDDWPQIRPERRTALAQITEFDKTGCSFISHDWTDLQTAPVQALAKRHIPILCWTIRSPEQEAQARRIAQNITFEGYLP